MNTTELSQLVNQVAELLTENGRGVLGLYVTYVETDALVSLLWATTAILLSVISLALAWYRVKQHTYDMEAVYWTALGGIALSLFIVGAILIKDNTPKYLYPEGAVVHDLIRR